MTLAEAVAEALPPTIPLWGPVEFVLCFGVGDAADFVPQDDGVFADEAADEPVGNADGRFCADALG
jgi:hypothetical protein